MDAVGPAPALVLALTPIVYVENGTRPLMVTEVVELSRKLGVENESFTAFSVVTPVYST